MPRRDSVTVSPVPALGSPPGYDPLVIAHQDNRRLLTGVGLSAIVATLLAGCTPELPSALRLNEDGSIDFASCDAVDSVGEAIATTSLRTGDFGKVDPSTEVSVDLDPPIEGLPTGNYINFDALPERWDRLDVYVYSTDGDLDAYAYAERENLKVGEWRWLDGTTGPTHRLCAIGEEQQPAAAP